MRRSPRVPPPTNQALECRGGAFRIRRRLSPRRLADDNLAVRGQRDIARETLELLGQKGVGVHVLPTQDAVDLYNELRKTEQVAGLFHTTY
jgi:hypothetical protein